MPLTHPPFMRLLRSRALRDPRFIGALAAALPGGSLLAWSHFVEPRRLEITRHHAPLPDGGPPLTALHLTDLHLLTEDAWARGIVDRLEGLGCDLLLLTGDLIHLGADLAQVERLLARLPRPRLGAFACLGNWDRWAGPPLPDFTAMLTRLGVRLLVNALALVDAPARRICIVGVDDLLSGEPDVAILDQVPPGHAALVLSHTPTLFPALAARGADLVLAGHTHGGQIRLPGRGAVWMPVGSGHYDAGWFEVEGARMYVGRGIGMSVAPLRLMCRPEAALLTL